MSSIFIKCMEGIGDNIYARPFVKILVGEGHDVYMSTVLPDLFADLPVKFIDLGPSRYRTQLHAQAKSKIAYTEGPEVFDRVIKVYYGAKEAKAHNIINSMELAFGYVPGSTTFKMDLPDTLPPHGLKLPGKVAIVKPVTHRKEWMNTARSPRPQYIGWCARMLKDAGYYVISIADTKDGQEWIEQPEPIADLQLHENELGLYGTLSLFRDAEIVVTGSGFAAPAAIAAGANLFAIFGGRGGYDNPHKLFDLRMDMQKIGWALPEKFCRCYYMEHSCDKTIRNLDDYFYKFMSQSRPARSTVELKNAAGQPLPMIEPAGLVSDGVQRITVDTVQGIGDIFWVYQKLSPHFDEINFNVMVTKLDDKIQARSTEFLSLLPKVKEAKFVQVLPDDYQKAAVGRFNLKEILFMAKKTKGYTAVYAVNKPLELGVRLDEIDQGLAVEWGVPIKHEPSGLLLKPKKYGVLYVSGGKSTTVKLWGIDEWLRFVLKFYKVNKLTCPLVLVGAEYDRVNLDPLSVLLKEHGIEVIEHYETLPKSINTIKNAKFFLGYQSGLSVIADNFDTPQVMIYFDHLKPMLNAWAKRKNIDAGTYMTGLFTEEPEKVAARSWLPEGEL